jgi:hypothetical protein
MIKLLKAPEQELVFLLIPRALLASFKHSKEMEFQELSLFSKKMTR